MIHVGAVEVEKYPREQVHNGHCRNQRRHCPQNAGQPFAKGQIAVPHLIADKPEINRDEGCVEQDFKIIAGCGKGEKPVRARKQAAHNVGRK
ncbi:hypothetical protein SDC9_112765 [bioreactor metagenome]|uniref:Uncharacterized protein n=1 Tax=bioreactor metagenome TaxID=1076179 RepID=A0A645BMT5_9ZZZZ